MSGLKVDICRRSSCSSRETRTLQVLAHVVCCFPVSSCEAQLFLSLKASPSHSFGFPLIMHYHKGIACQAMVIYKTQGTSRERESEKLLTHVCLPPLNWDWQCLQGRKWMLLIPLYPEPRAALSTEQISSPGTECIYVTHGRRSVCLSDLWSFLSLK